MASKTFINGGVDNNWSTAGNWSPVASVPASGDDVFFNASSPNCVVDAASASLKSLDMNGYLGTLSGSANIFVVAAASTTVVCRFGGTITWTGILSLRPNSTAGIISLTTGGKTLASVSLNTNAGTVNLLDDMTTTGSWTVTAGTFNAVGRTINCGVWQFSGVTARAIDITNSTININSTGTVVNGATTTNLTLTAAGTTVNITNTSSTAKTLNLSGTAGAGEFVVDTIDIAAGGSGAVNIHSRSDNVVDALVVNGPKSVVFVTGVDHGLSFNTLSVVASVESLVAISTDIRGTSVSLIDLDGGTNTFSYSSFQDIAASGATFDASDGTNIDMTGNSGIDFPPSMAGRRVLLGVG